MSKLDELIQKYCPNGVEYKPLGEVCEIVRGVRVTREILSENGTIPVYQNALTPLGYFDKSNRKGYKTFVIGAGAAGKIGFSDIDFWAADDCYTFDDLKELNDKFLFYFLQTKQSYIDSRIRKGSIPRISRDNFEKIQIPLPPLPVQEEIVRILDKFTELTNELTNELTLRRKQYEHYRDALLTQETKIERFTIKDLFDTRNGYTPSTKNAEFWESGTIPWFVMDDIRKNGRVLSDSIQHITKAAMKKSGLFPANSIIVATSATIGEHALITTDFLCNQRFTCLSPKAEFKNKIDMKYIFYYAFRLDEFCKKNQTQSTFASVDMSKFYEFEIPLPPLAVQQRIVSVLDNFDKICTDLKIGLPAEIDARKKQYEYYRDLLLRFEPLGTILATHTHTHTHTHTM